MAEVRATPRGYRRGAAWSVLLAVALTACLAWGGTVSTDLDQRLNATPATTRIQVFFLAKPPMDEDGMPFNVANAVAGLTGTEQRAAGVDALKSVTQQVLPPIAQALTAGGCTGIGIYDWASIGIAASCVPAVVRSVAARADVTFAEYNGPVGTDAVAGTLSGADIVHTRANLLSGPRGADTTVGIVDTGVSPNDPQLGGRVLCKDTGACHDSVSVCLQPYWRDRYGLVPQQFPRRYPTRIQIRPIATQSMMDRRILLLGWNHNVIEKTPHPQSCHQRGNKPPALTLHHSLPRSIRAAATRSGARR